MVLIDGNACSFACRALPAQLGDPLFNSRQCLSANRPDGKEQHLTLRDANNEPMSLNMSDASHLMHTYNRLPVKFTRGEGCWLFDAQGKRYLDALCGISVTNLGHCHPAVTNAIMQQANTLLHTSNLYHIPAQEELADQLCGVSNMDRVFFSNSGAEANEAAIKLARLHAHNNGNSQPIIVTFEGSFHGRTLATIAATGNEGIRRGFGPVLPGFVHLPLNDSAAAEALFAQHTTIAAVLIEPVQGEGGIHAADPAFLKKLEQLCCAQGALLMLDEVQSGNGRCGNYFAYQNLDGTEFALQPDVVTTAKGLGNGIPIGACLARGEAASVMAPGKHGSTFGGNPFASKVGSTVVQTIMDDHLPARALKLGQHMHSAFSAALDGMQGVRDIRHSGLMLGIELDRPCAELMAMGLQQGIIINVTAGSVVRLLPPLVMSDGECNQVIEQVSALIVDYLSKKD